MTIFFLVLVGAVVAADTAADSASSDAARWSDPVNGLEARVTLVERSKFNGTRQIVPYLELRNVSDVANRMMVHCDSRHVRFEVLGADGNTRRAASALSRSGPHADPGTVVLPFDSSMRIGMYCSNWGVPGNAAAMISTDSGAWVFDERERGQVYLRAVIEGEPAESPVERMWQGVIETPAVRVDW